MKTKETFPKWEDIIFENRNKIYGAYELRTQYTSRLSRAFLITLSGSILLFLLLYFSVTKKHIATVTTTKDSVVFSQIFFKVEENPVAVRTQTPPKSSAGKPESGEFAVVNDTTPFANDTTGSNGKNAINDTITVIANSGDSANHNSGDGINASRNDTFSIASVEKQPEFPGGLEKFYRYLVNRIHYTREAIGAKVNKRAYVGFIVNEEGLISDVVIYNDIGFGLDEAVKEVLLNSPKWSPGVVRNRPVKTKMVLPVNFRLAE